MKQIDNHKKLILHTEENRKLINDRRLFESAAESPLVRWKQSFVLLNLAMMFRKNNEPFKQPEGKGIVLKRS